MTTLAEVREGIRSVLATIPDLNTSDVELGNSSFPCATVLTPSFDYYTGGTFGSTGLTGTIEFEVFVAVGAQLTDEGARNLTAYADWSGDRSVIQAFANNAGLDGLVDDCVVMSFRSMGIEDVGGVGAWGGLFTIRALPRRTAT